MEKRREGSRGKQLEIMDGMGGYRPEHDEKLPREYIRCLEIKKELASKGGSKAM